MRDGTDSELGKIYRNNRFRCRSKRMGQRKDEGIGNGEWRGQGEEMTGRKEGIEVGRKEGPTDNATGNEVERRGAGERVSRQL